MGGVGLSPQPPPPKLSAELSNGALGPVQGCVGTGGGGVWNPKVCVPKMPQINVSVWKFHFSNHEIWFQGGGGASCTRWGPEGGGRGLGGVRGSGLCGGAAV